MLALTTARKERIEARLAALEARAVSLETAISSAMESHIQEYSFNSGDGAQRVVNRSISAMQQSLDLLYRQIDFQYNLLHGRGLVQISMRRR